MNDETRTADSGSRPSIRRALAAIGTLVATIAVGIVVGPLGALVAIGVGGAQYLVSTTAAFATGQIVLAALFPSGGSLVALVLAEVGLLCVLCSTAVEHHAPVRSIGAALVAGVTIGGSGWLAYRSSATVWIGAGVIVATTALVAYGLHRYERVQLGLVEAP